MALVKFLKHKSHKTSGEFTTALKGKATFKVRCLALIECILYIHDIADKANCAPKVELLA